MPNVLALSFEGFSFSSRQLYEHLFPMVLSRAAVHESLTIDDALNWIGSGWPNIILVTDPEFLTSADSLFFQTLIEYTNHGCTVICMGLFAGAVEPENLDFFFQSFGLRWRSAKIAQHEVKLVANDATMIRTRSLIPAFSADMLLVGGVPRENIVYQAFDPSGTTLAYAAFGRVGLGRLGYIGDTGFGEEAERLILAMCHLDRPEDSLQIEDQRANRDQQHTRPGDIGLQYFRQ